ncbi:hypothetical protein EDD36DRAFT_415229 [Exophiala viscosa]|uniref:Uncharacterized protein n=1 Tax=Exophiala viscosa TaxID=2486360 RepID=A0AAN6IFP4_9EURO|nr:hypothetical protein EDD36DRAFT_415229 [Exophiala viscosa]
MAEFGDRLGSSSPTGATAQDQLQAISKQLETEIQTSQDLRQQLEEARLETNTVRTKLEGELETARRESQKELEKTKEKLDKVQQKIEEAKVELGDLQDSVQALQEVTDVQALLDKSERQRNATQAEADDLVRQRDEARRSLGAAEREVSRLGAELDDALESRTQARLDKVTVEWELREARLKAVDLKIERDVAKAGSENYHELLCKRINEVNDYKRIIACGDFLDDDFDICTVSNLFQGYPILHAGVMTKVCKYWLLELSDMTDATQELSLPYVNSMAYFVFQTAMLEPAALNHLVIATFVRTYLDWKYGVGFPQPLVFLEAALFVLANPDQKKVQNFLQDPSTCILRIVELWGMSYWPGERLNGVKAWYQTIKPRLEQTTLVNRALVKRLDMGFENGFETATSLVQIACDLLEELSDDIVDLRAGTRMISADNSILVLQTDPVDAKARDIQVLPPDAMECTFTRSNDVEVTVNGYPRPGMKLVVVLPFIDGFAPPMIVWHGKRKTSTMETKGQHGQRSFEGEDSMDRELLIAPHVECIQDPKCAETYLIALGAEQNEIP